MKCLIFGLIVSSVSYATAIRVENGAYQNVVIEIQKDVPHSNCLDLLNTLQVSYSFHYRCTRHLSNA